MMSNKSNHPWHFRALLALFIALNLVVVVFKPIFVDPALYWLYGLHLAPIYFDCPPLIAVVTRIATDIFGTHAWVINGLGLVFTLAAARYLYLLAQAKYSKQMAELVTLVWLFTPAIGHVYVRFNWNYINLLSLFWIMSFYYIYQAQKTQRPYYFYACAVALGLAILSHFEAALLLLTLLVIVCALPSYRQLLKNVHTYIALVLMLLIGSPVLYGLIITQAHAVLLQFSFHATSDTTTFSFWSFLSFLNDIINELDFFFVFGIVLLIRHYKLISRDESLKFFLLSAVVIFIPFFLLSFHTSFPIKYYLLFYYGFILLTIPLVSVGELRVLKWILWINIILFVINSWNVVVPRYGISPGGNTFYLQNLRQIAGFIQPNIQDKDLLLGCTRNAEDVDNQDGYSHVALLAFYLNHKNTYATTQGFFTWQKPIEEVLTEHKNQRVFYVCEDTVPPVIPHLDCSAPQKIIGRSYQLNTPIENQFYLQVCHST